MLKEVLTGRRKFSDHEIKSHMERKTLAVMLVKFPYVKYDAMHIVSAKLMVIEVNSAETGRIHDALREHIPFEWELRVAYDENVTGDNWLTSMED
jgi:hypothetical protein